jgi:hypothetical protein
MHQARPAIPDFPAIYTAQHLALTPAEVDTMFAQDRRWQLGPTLAKGGVVVFPHVAVADCGHHVAVAVEAVLDSGADKVLVVGVLHAWTAEMEETRARGASGEDLSGHPLRGIHGPTLTGSRDEWRLDHSLIGWRYFWQAACERRGITHPPKVMEVYPFLTGVSPETLPRYDEVARFAEDAVVVSTSDPLHHGIGYATPPDQAKAWDAGGEELARWAIGRYHELLGRGDYPAFLAHCLATRNDSRDSGPLYRSLRGPLTGTLVDLGWCDARVFYDAPPPTWVVAALSAWEPVA